MVHFYGWLETKCMNKTTKQQDNQGSRWGIKYFESRGRIRADSMGDMRTEVVRVVSEFEEDIKEDTLSHTFSILKHPEDNKQFRTHFSKDADTVFNAIPCNPFEINFVPKMIHHIFSLNLSPRDKEILTAEKAHVKSFIKNLNQKIPIFDKIPKNNFFY